VNGRKIFASLAGAADYYGILCGEAEPGEQASRRDTLYLAVPATAPGVEVVGDGIRSACAPPSRAPSCSRTC
jgi:alkylation response protein AidB-like acyl-CoA dehydrogenase